MPATFISEPLTPDGSFDPLAISRGEPGLPAKFRWRERELIVAEVLDTSRAYGDCKHGSGERYLRKHCFRLRTTDGLVLRIYFQRTSGKARASARWWLQSIEESSAGTDWPDPVYGSQAPKSAAIWRASTSHSRDFRIAHSFTASIDSRTVLRCRLIPVR